MAIDPVAVSIPLSFAISVARADHPAAPTAQVVSLVVGIAVDFKVVLGQHLLEGISLVTQGRGGVSLLQGKENLAGEETVGTGLVGGAKTSDGKHLGKSAQATVLVGVRKLTGK